jgi:hypothetical protein
MTGQANGSMTHGRRNSLTSTSVLRTVSDLILSGTRRMTSKPIGPYVVNHQMEISYACRVDGFEIPRGEPAPAVIEIGRPTGKTQSRRIKGYSLKPAAG